MTVSVVIPAYNEAEHLEECLRSLQNQLVPPDEIILVDNNSTDKTVEIARRYGLKILHEKKQGVIFTRNLGFNHAKYDLIARTDADCVLPPEWIKKIKEDFTKNKIDAVAGPWYFQDIPIPHLSAVKLAFFLAKIAHKHEIVSGPNMAITRKIWLKIKNDVCLDLTQVYDDIDISIHVHRVGGIIWYDNQLVVKTSGRRVKRGPIKALVEYLSLVNKGLQTHKVTN